MWLWDEMKDEGRRGVEGTNADSNLVGSGWERRSESQNRVFHSICPTIGLGNYTFIHFEVQRLYTN